MTHRDPYFWMRDRSDPDVLEYLREENDYTERMMKHTRELREYLFLELKSRIPEKDRSVPYRKGDYWYYYRLESGKQYEIYCRISALVDGPEEILLDLNEMAEGHSYCDLGAFEVSPDGRWLAYTIDMVGREKYTLHFRNLVTGEILDEHVTRAYTRVQWANDSKTVFYTTLGRSLRPNRLLRHRVGTFPRDDTVVYTEKDQAFRLTITRSRSGQYLFLRSESQVTTEVRVLDADEPASEFRVVQRRRKGTEYYLMHRGDRLYILTNYRAPNFRIVSAPLEAPGKENWETVVPHRDEVLIEDAEMFANHLVLFERHQGLNALRVIDLRTGKDHYVELGESLCVCWSGNNPEYNSHTFRYVYSSLVTPETVVDYDMETREQTILKVEQVAGGYTSSDYEAHRIFASTEDGTRVPISLVHRKGLKQDGPNPLLLYGYGAYGESSEPEFWSGRLSLLDRGFVYAIAHVRGGSELGSKWYQEGKLLAKMNTFTDFIACAEHLIAEGYTSSARLVINGTSAGGLLIGVVVNLRPDLCQAAIADVPFVDVVNTMMDETIPRTITEYDEWGNPIEDQRVHEYLRSYSPYENVGPKDYPSMLITAGLDDPRVHYWEPAKWTARLRALKTDDNLLLLRTRFRSGHFGPTGRFDYLEEFAFELAFIFDVLGIAR
jgi:oligopeptidase B